MKVVFFGTSSFAARVLSFLVEKGVEVVAVVTRPDRPQGRSLHLQSPPVKEFCLVKSLSLPILQPIKASTPEFAETLRSFQPDLFLVVAYGEIIKKNILDLPRLGCINIHASLLPKYRGAAPIQRCLMDGEVKTGITIIEMSAQMDAGDVLSMASIPVSEEMTFGELEPRLCELGCQQALKVINQFRENSISKTPQDHSQATLAPKIVAADEEIIWGKSAQAIHNLIRALSPKPGAWCNLFLADQPRRLKIKKSLVIPGLQGAPGEILQFSKEGWIVACGQDAIRLLEVQMEGKKAMPIEDFVRGIHQPMRFV